jgi:hypothetical protein
MIHTLNRRDLVELIGGLKSEKVGPAVTHALAVRSALSSGDYLTFFKFYHEAPNMSSYLMDHFLHRERLRTSLKLVRAYRPTLTVNFFCINLGFKRPSSSPDPSRKELNAAFEWLRGIGLTVKKGDIDCKVAVPIIQEQYTDLATSGVDIKGQIH